MSLFHGEHKWYTGEGKELWIGSYTRIDSLAPDFCGTSINLYSEELVKRLDHVVWNDFIAVPKMRWKRADFPLNAYEMERVVNGTGSNAIGYLQNFRDSKNPPDKRYFFLDVLVAPRVFMPAERDEIWELNEFPDQVIRVGRYAVTKYAEEFKKLKTIWVNGGLLMTPEVFDILGPSIDRRYYKIFEYTFEISEGHAVLQNTREHSGAMFGMF
ncbi:MAG: hypothetical protein JJU11_02735 [Candidatus Sumerlaeia bacterium]|nr:hypothetical protein [Candidatus Sumerlaeia bacterium]